MELKKLKSKKGEKGLTLWKRRNDGNPLKIADFLAPEIKPPPKETIWEEQEWFKTLVVDDE